MWDRMESLPKLLILLEDRPSDALLFVKVTKELMPHLQVKVFSDGISFEAWLQQAEAKALDQIALVFLDINLPLKNGFQCLALLKEHPRLRDVPSLFLTTSSQPAEIERAHREGIHSYIVKPLEIQDFRDIMRKTYQDWLGMATTPPSENPRSHF